MNKFSPTVIEKPWGKEILWAHTPSYVGKILQVNAGESLSIQYHHHKDSRTSHFCSHHRQEYRYDQQFQGKQ